MSPMGVPNVSLPPVGQAAVRVLAVERAARATPTVTARFQGGPATTCLRDVTQACNLSSRA
jgi:hypothetical protein